MTMAELSAQSPPETDLIVNYQSRIETALQALDLGGELPILDDPIRYVLDGGGKRLRPVLLLLATRLWSEEIDSALPAALAVEVFHNFTLVHDDIMDHSSERRGRAAVHERWDESTAILSGDYMLGLSYRLLTEARGGDLRALLGAYNRMVRLLCEGQALDKWFEQQINISVDDYYRMIHAKTGALIECALELGGILGGAADDELETIRRAGRHIGRAFQMQDDLLDVTATDPRWGKPVGGDLVEGKRTFVLLRALERATGDEREWFEEILRRPGIERSRIPEARERLERLGVLAEAESVVNRESEAALEAISTLPAGSAREALAGLVTTMRTRAH